MSEKLTPVVCPFCGFGCRLYIKSFNGEPIGIEFYGEPGSVNEGKLCPKGVAAPFYLRHPDRLKKPLKRVGEKGEGKFKEITWSEAFKEITTMLNAIKKEYGPDAVGFFSSARCTNEENYLIQKIARVFGTNNIDHCARLCHSSTVAGLLRTVGAGAQTNPYTDILKTNVIFIIGYNPAESHPVFMRYILKAKDRGTKIIVADPRRTRTAWFADIYMQHYPGTDIALLNGMMHVIIKEELYDKEFVITRTVGFEKLRTVVSKYTPEYVEKITGVPAQTIVEAARTFATAGRGVVMWAMGLTQHICGTENVMAAATLAMICGYVGREGCGLFPMRGQNNVQGACDLGALPNLLPGYRKVTDDAKRKEVAKHWGLEDLPSEPGLTIVEMIHGAHEGKIKALYIMGENPAVSDPNLNLVRKALKELEFLVVQDIFLTETAMYADIVLPAAAWGEKAGSYTASERRVQWSFKACEPPGEAKPDWLILSRLGKELGLPSWPDYSSPEDILREINRVVPQYKGITPERLKNNLAGIQWPCPGEDHPGTPRLHVERFLTPDGKGHLAAVEYRPPAEVPDEEYPLILTTVRIVGQYHTLTMSNRIPYLKKRWPEPYVEINPVDAEKYGIKDGESVVIITRRGQFECKAKITRSIKPGVVSVPWHWGANVLTNDVLDPISKIPEYKVCACKIVKKEV